MSEYPEYPHGIPQVIVRKYPTVETPQVGVLGKKQTETHIKVEYIRKDIYNNLLKRVREAAWDIGNCPFAYVPVAEVTTCLKKHLPELGEDTIKRVLNENMDAWKELAKGDEDETNNSGDMTKKIGNDKESEE